MISEIISSIFLLAGAFLILIASIGILRMPDIYMRMHAATKAVSLGIMLMLMGISVYYPQFSIIIKSLAIIIFLYLTMPVSASLLGRSSLEMNLPQWKRKNGSKNS